MRTILFLVLWLPALHGQVASMTWSAAYNYSNQFDGSNGWAHTGNFTDHDTTEATWCADGKTYETGNDGKGPQSVLQPTGDRSIFLNTLTDFSLATQGSVGVTETLVNSMDDYGVEAHDVYNNGTSVKGGGLLCLNGVLYWNIYQQSATTTWTGSMSNILKSTDNGATWVNPAHTKHSTGAATIIPSATGDLPSVNNAMFGAKSDVKYMHFVQLCQDGSINCPSVENNSTWTYGVAVSALGIHLYTFRVLSADMPKLDGSLYSWYKGGGCTADASWDVIGNKIAGDPIMETGTVHGTSSPLWIPNMNAYVIWIGGASSNFYQSPSICGPWTFLFSVASQMDESWYTPVLSSLTMGTNTATINFLTTFSPAERSGPPENRYDTIFHVATFTGVARARLNPHRESPKD